MCEVEDVISDVSQSQARGFGSHKHHTPQASSGDPAGVQDAPTHVPVATPDQSHRAKARAIQSIAPELLCQNWEIQFWCVEGLGSVG